MKITDEMKPCPFCGGAGDFCNTGVWWVRCDDCNAEAGADDTQAGAVAMWNRRAALAAAVQEGEAVAWRWKFDPEMAWHYGPNRPGPFRFGDPDIIEPLYARPAPADAGVVEEAVRRLSDTLDAFDSDVADELLADGERADLWTEIEVNVDDLRSVLSALRTKGGE